MIKCELFSSPDFLSFVFGANVVEYKKAVNSKTNISLQVIPCSR